MKIVLMNVKLLRLSHDSMSQVSQARSRRESPCACYFKAFFLHWVINQWRSYLVIIVVRTEMYDHKWEPQDFGVQHGAMQLGRPLPNVGL